MKNIENTDTFSFTLLRTVNLSLYRSSRTWNSIELLEIFDTNFRPVGKECER